MTFRVNFDSVILDHRSNFVPFAQAMSAFGADLNFDI
jgi:hypothetical protein